MTTNFFFTPLFCCGFWVRDPGWVKIRTRDKHPGSATLQLRIATEEKCLIHKVNLATNCRSSYELF
jgi:hypothetical protein